MMVGCLFTNTTWWYATCLQDACRYGSRGRRWSCSGKWFGNENDKMDAHTSLSLTLLHLFSLLREREREHVWQREKRREVEDWIGSGEEVNVERLRAFLASCLCDSGIRDFNKIGWSTFTGYSQKINSTLYIAMCEIIVILKQVTRGSVIIRHLA